MKPDPSDLGLRFEALPSDDRPPAIRLRLLLKHALRSLGLRCTGYIPPGCSMPPLPPELDPYREPETPAHDPAALGDNMPGFP